MQNKPQLAGEVKHVFERGDVEFIECLSGFCFDFVAKKRNLIMLLKLLFNIDSLTPGTAGDMKAVADSLSTYPLLIGKRTRGREMEDGVVYERYGISSVTPNTLEDAVAHRMLPSIISARGGYYVAIDGEKLRETRVKKSISLGELAEKAGVTRRMMCKYESEDAKPALSIALKLEESLSGDFIACVNIFSRPIIEESPELEMFSAYKKAVFSKLASVGMEVHPAKRAPFDAVALAPEEKKAMLGRAEEKALSSSAEEVKFLKQMLELILMDAFFVFNYSKEKNMEGMPVLVKKEIDRIRSAEELIELIEKRKG